MHHLEHDPTVVSGLVGLGARGIAAGTLVPVTPLQIAQLSKPYILRAEAPRQDSRRLAAHRSEDSRPGTRSVIWGGLHDREMDDLQQGRHFG